MNKIINPVEYKMPEALGRNLLKTKKNADPKATTQQYLCKYVNEQCGVKGTCVKVIFY